jgi:hypothetical protein
MVTVQLLAAEFKKAPFCRSKRFFAGCGSAAGKKRREVRRKMGLFEPGCEPANRLRINKIQLGDAKLKIKRHNLRWNILLAAVGKHISSSRAWRWLI